MSFSLVHINPEDGSSWFIVLFVNFYQTPRHQHPRTQPSSPFLLRAPRISHNIHNVLITTPRRRLRRLQMQAGLDISALTPASLNQRHVMNNRSVTLLRVYSARDETAFVRVFPPLLLETIRTINYANEIISLCRETHFLSFNICGKPTVTHVPHWLIFHMYNAHPEA